MKAQRINFKSEDDEHQALRHWQAMHLTSKIIKKYPIERLPLSVVPPRPYRTIEALDQFSILIEYEET